MPIWPVYVQDWQYECCGEPFGVGDRVRWTLLLTEDTKGDWGWPEPMLADLGVVGRRFVDSEEEGTTEVVSTWEGPEIALEPSAGRNRDVVRGSLVEDHHGGVPADLRPVEGVVRGLKVVSQRFRLSDRYLTPIPGAVRFRNVERMPDAFAHPHPHDQAREQWMELGALAELDLDSGR